MFQDNNNVDKDFYTYTLKNYYRNVLFNKRVFRSYVFSDFAVLIVNL